jgi:ComF family protein
VKAVSRGPYEGVLRDLVHLLKYDRVQSAAGILGKQLASALTPVLLEAGPSAILIPVPLHVSKLRVRGFNQAERIAAATVKKLKGEVELNSNILVRHRATESQTGLTRHQRRENIRGAFRVDPKMLHHIARKNIILVDDVFTTGTTAEECSRVLLRAGAQHVWVATVARVSKLEGVRLEVRGSFEPAGVAEQF